MLTVAETRHRKRPLGKILNRVRFTGCGSIVVRASSRNICTIARSWPSAAPQSTSAASDPDLHGGTAGAATAYAQILAWSYVRVVLDASSRYDLEAGQREYKAAAALQKGAFPRDKSIPEMPRKHKIVIWTKLARGFL
jgi:hypothetical protein